MGYYTTFRLSVRNGEVTEEMQTKLKEIMQTKLKEIKSDDFTGYDMEDLIEGEYEAKWYDWKEDLIKLSKAFPTEVFELSGEGEEREDMWRAYFKNGKVQIEKAEIRIGEYDETKLI